MSYGIGVDVLSLTRLASTLDEGDPFYRRAFSDREKQQAAERSARHEYLSGRFCAKEAVYKAISLCGIEFCPHDIEIVDNAEGRPVVCISGETAEALEKVHPGCSLLVSISHEDDCVIAFALCE